MSRSLATCAEGHDNNFNLIRFIAASVVLFSHSFALTGNELREPLRRLYHFNMGDVAVLVFFSISGFLVCRSLLRYGDVVGFVLARMLRILPGLLVANLFAVFAIGASYTQLSLSAYLHNVQTYEYLWRNTKLLFSSIQYRLPGVFADVPYPEIVNGSLWSLRPEIKLYLWLALIGIGLKLFASRLNPLRTACLFGALTMLCIVDYLFDYQKSGGAEMRETLSILFFIGATFAAASKWIRLDTRVALLLLGVLLATACFANVVVFGITLTLGYLVLCVAYIPKGRALTFNRLGDYSYGIYIYAFPVQQAVAASFPGISPLQMSLLAFPIVLLLSIASWYAIEKPMLAFKRYRAAGPVVVENCDAGNPQRG